MRIAAFNTVAFKVAASDDRGAGGEGDAAGVDEAATATGDAGRVGNNHLGVTSGHFKIAEKLAGVGGDDFIKDDARGASRQPGVALYPATELGLDVGAAVVENGALGGNVKLAVGVARNPGSTGGLDVDQWDAVAGLQHSRLLAAGSGFVGDDLGVGRGHAKHHTQGGHHGEGHRAQGSDERGGKAGRFAGAASRFAFANGSFGHSHQLATFLVEDDPVTTLVHECST